MQIAHGHSGEVLQSTTCDRCGVEVGLSASHVPDSRVLCSPCATRPLVPEQPCNGGCAGAEDECQVGRRHRLVNRELGDSYRRGALKRWENYRARLRCGLPGWKNSPRKR